MTLCVTQSLIAQKTFKLGFVSTFKDSGDSIWLANSQKKDRINNKAIARLGDVDGGLGKININGRDIELKSIKCFSPDRNYKVGRGGYEIWKGKGVTARLDYIWTWLCPPENDNCEIYRYKGILDVKYKGFQRKVKVIGVGGS